MCYRKDSSVLCSPVTLRVSPGRAWWAEPSGRSRYLKSLPPRTSRSPSPRGQHASEWPQFPLAAMTTDNIYFRGFHDDIRGTCKHLDGEQLQRWPGLFETKSKWLLMTGGLDAAAHVAVFLLGCWAQEWIPREVHKITRTTMTDYTAAWRMTQRRWIITKLHYSLCETRWDDVS